MDRWRIRLWLGRDFPRRWDGLKGDPLQPRTLGRALIRASRADHRKHIRHVGSDGWRAPRSAALIGSLPEETRRRIARRLQEERTGLLGGDAEWPVSLALSQAHCGWDPEEAHRLFALALQGIDPVRPVTDIDPISVELPLAACAELDSAGRGEMQPYLRTLLAASLTPRADAPDDALVQRIRGLLTAPFASDWLFLPSRDGIVASARCGLGATFYEEPVLRLLRLCNCRGAERPPASWRGSVRELLTVSPTAHAALRALLAAGRGEPDGCECPSGHPVRPHLVDERGDRLLTGLAWAVPLSDDPEALRQLDRTLAFHTRRPVRSGATGFIRAGISVLSALERKPSSGVELTALHDLIDGIGPLGLTVPLGDYTAVFEIKSQGTVALRFRRSSSRGFLKDVPADVRRNHPALYAAVRVRLAELRTHLDIHRTTLNGLLRADPGTPAARWYGWLDDPALRPLSRALVWQADTPSGMVTGLPVRRRRSGPWVLRGLDDRFHELADDTPVRLWSRALADAAETAAWRAELASRRIRQPVRQV